MASLGLNLSPLASLTLNLLPPPNPNDPPPPSGGPDPEPPPPPGPCAYMRSLIEALAYAIDQHIIDIPTRQVALTHLGQCAFRVEDHCTANPDPTDDD